MPCAVEHCGGRLSMVNRWHSSTRIVTDESLWFTAACCLRAGISKTDGENGIGAAAFTENGFVACAGWRRGQIHPKHHGVSAIGSVVNRQTRGCVIGRMRQIE